MNKPTKEGWYWCKMPDDDEWEAVNVYDFFGVLTINVCGCDGNYHMEDDGFCDCEWGEPVAPNGLRGELISIARKLGEPKRGFGYRKGFNKCRGIVSNHVVAILDKW